MKERIIIDSKKGTHNDYECDMSKPYKFADISTLFEIIVVTFVLTVVSGIPFLLLLLARPEPGSELPRIIFLILCAILWLASPIIGIFISVREAKNKKKLEKLLENSNILLGTVIDIERKTATKGIYRVKVQFDFSNEIMKVTTRKKHWPPNFGVAIAKNGDNQFILTECTLTETYKYVTGTNTNPN